MIYRKHFVPLESSPDVFTGLMHDLGVSTSLEFVDIWSIDDPEQLALVLRPVLALILVLPTSDAYERHKSHEESNRDFYNGSGCGEDVVWFQQTINNACGLYALLHAVCNIERSKFVEANSILDRLVTSCLQLAPPERAEIVENLRELEHAYTKAAFQGSSEPPLAEDEVDCHYVCYIKGSNGSLYELDGDLKGPVKKDLSFGKDNDVLSDRGLEVIKDHIQRENGCNLHFSLLALVFNPDK